MNDIRFQRQLTYILVVSIVVLILAVSIFRKNQSAEIKYIQLLMGTVVEITLYGNDEQLLKLASDAGFEEIKRLEALMSHYKDGSDVARINKYAGIEYVKVSQETIDVIETAKKASEMSSGSFDITMGVLGKVWHFTKDDKGEPVPPEKYEVETLLPLIDYQQIIIDRNSNTVKLGRKGMRINLGGIAKGYIVSKAVEKIKSKGIKKGIIHAGGDMFVFNESDNKPFKIGIQHPREKDK
ncbi:MAG: FAD:protein FMN transferase, partial [Deltaproteobacteria bacterium]|nr:FAD:protein FMN transferase [Deltaproteobacteria bacterium]